jgi:hypothetical protein
MSAAEDYAVGAMQILVADGKWKFGPTNRDDPELEMVVQGHAFTISVVIMDLPYQDGYPILLG